MEQNDLQTLRLFSPLFPKVYRRDEYGDLENMPEDITAEEACDYEGEILALIEREQLPNEGDHGLAVYLDLRVFNDARKNLIAITRSPFVKLFRDCVKYFSEFQN